MLGIIANPCSIIDRSEPNDFLVGLHIHFADFRLCRTGMAVCMRGRSEQSLMLCGAVGVDGGADDADLVRRWDQFEAAALQRAHLDHFV
jgi:hypothetical protein